MSSSFHSSRPHSSPRTPSVISNSSNGTPYSSHITSQNSYAGHEMMMMSSSSSVSHYSRQAQHIVAQIQQREAEGTPDNPIELSASNTPTRPPAFSPQERSRSTPSSMSRLARHSMPTNNNSTQSPLIGHSTSWNHPPSSTRSADYDASYVVRWRKLSMEHGKLQESHQALYTENVQLRTQSEEWKTKTAQLEARLLESMQSRSAREHKFQEEMKRQRASMNSLFSELADSKREVERLKKELQDTSTRLQLQQALTANIAFQQEQEELEYQMELEQYRKRQQQLQQGDVPVDDDGYYPNDDGPLKMDSNTRESGFSRLGNYFNRRRVGGTPGPEGSLSTVGTISSESVTSSTALSLAASKSSEIGRFTSYEESKNDLFEQMQDDYGANEVHKLFETETTTTATTEDSSMNLAASKYVLPSEDYLKSISTKKSQRSRSSNEQKVEEMNYGQTSAGMPPAAPMSRLDRIRQKRRNLEAMFRQNGASATVLAKPASSGLPPRGRAHYQAKTPSQNLVNLMNHRHHDD